MKKLFSIIAAALFCTTMSAQQLNESFEGEQFPPEGWTTSGGSQYSQWTKSVKEGRQCAYVKGSYGWPESWLITPELKPANGEKLQFSARVGDNTAKGELRVEVSLTGTETSSFEVVETYYTSSKATSNKIAKSDWSNFSIDLSAYAGQRIFIAFHQANECDGIYLDDVKGVTLAGSATCDVPTNIVVSNITDEGATISWNGEAAEYQYVCMLQGEAADWSKAVKTSEKSVTLTNLYESTAYDFFVRSYCSDSEQSLAPKVPFQTTCELQSVPWVETFSRDATGAIAPDCWFVASENPQVWVVADKTYDDEGEAQTIYGQAHLYAAGGGPNTAQVFALPVFDAQLNTLEIAFDYKTSMVDANYGVPEIGFMTNPLKASTFVSLQVLPQTLTYVRKTVVLSDLPADAKFIAFRFAGGTSDFSGLSMDNFVVAEIGKSGEIDPSKEELPDAAIWSLSYCEAGFTWYGYNTEAFAIGLGDAQGRTIAGIVATTGECDRFAYQDGVAFSEDDDYENHYYCSTKWILNAEEEGGGQFRGDGWEDAVINVGTAATPLLGLKPDKYQVQVLSYNTTTGTTTPISTIQFELVSKEITNLEVVVAEDHKTATFTWEQPALSTGERLYVSVRSGETVAYDNFENAKEKAVSPLTVEVEEGKSYDARFQIIDKNNTPLGAEQVLNFTVGVNNYEPKNVHAEVFSGDNVTFSWEAATQADRYVIELIWEGAYYSSLTVNGLSKTTTMPKDGTWSWTVQAFNQGENGNYFEVSNPIAGNDFVSKGADIPEDAIQMDIWNMEAAYLDENSGYYQEGKHGWLIMLASGEEDGTGLPSPMFLLYTAKEGAISGVYNVARGNIDLESCYIDKTGKQADAVVATDAEVRLQFDGYDDEYFDQGYRYGYYTGSFRLVGNDGKTYVGKFMELFCNSYNFSSMGTGILDHKGMWDEDPDYDPHQGIEDIVISNDTEVRKVLHDGQLYIIRDNAIYTVSGQRVK